jgi:hypothetical protein
MNSSHKIQECLTKYIQLYGPLPWEVIDKTELEVLKDQEGYVHRISKILDAAIKFDLGEISVEASETLFETGKECAEEGLLSLPFEEIYVEATLVNGTAKKRFGFMYAPASKCFDEVLFERHPEFIDGTAALCFFRKSEPTIARGTWELPAVIAVFNWDFTETYIAPAALEFTDYAALTDEQWEYSKNLNTSMLYVAHSLINARGVKLQTEPAPVKLNRKRIQKNKPPLYEHHVLKIGGYSSSGRVLGVGASHASPRAHWRRGHIRTIRRGTPQQKRIRIPASLINGPGFVSKEYEISQ